MLQIVLYLLAISKPRVLLRRKERVRLPQTRFQCSRFQKSSRERKRPERRQRKALLRYVLYLLAKESSRVKWWCPLLYNTTFNRNPPCSITSPVFTIIFLPSFFSPQKKKEKRRRRCTTTISPLVWRCQTAPQEGGRFLRASSRATTTADGEGGRRPCASSVAGEDDRR